MKLVTVQKTIHGEQYECLVKAVKQEDFSIYKNLDITEYEDGKPFLVIDLNDIRMSDAMDEYSGRLYDLLSKGVHSSAELLVVYVRKGYKEHMKEQKTYKEF